MAELGLGGLGLCPGWDEMGWLVGCLAWPGSDRGLDSGLA